PGTPALLDLGAHLRVDEGAGVGEFGVLLGDRIAHADEEVVAGSALGRLDPDLRGPAPVTVAGVGSRAQGAASGQPERSRPEPGGMQELPTAEPSRGRIGG